MSQNKKYKMDITFKGQYVYVRATGEDSYEISLEQWKKIVKACNEYKCFKILGVSNTTNALTTLEAYDHQQIFKEVGITTKYRIAWAEINPEVRKMFEFVETVLTNRGMVIGRVFAEEDKARQWLLSEEGEKK